MSKLFQNKSLLKSIQVLLVCLIVLGGGLGYNNKAEADCSITGSYPLVTSTGCGGNTYSYSRNNGDVTVEYVGGESYKITDPDVTVLYRTIFSDCTTEACGFFTLLKENATGEYYFLIGEDDFMPGGCAVGDGSLCSAFINDFIAIVSEELIGGTIAYSSIIGGTGYSYVTADNGVDKIHFVFADHMGGFFLAMKGWSYVDIVPMGSISGSFTTSLNICDIVSASPPPSPPHPSPPPPTECKPGLVPCGRICDVSSTPYREDQPCTVCHLVLMMQLIMDFLFKIAAVVAAFFIAASGTMYIVSAGRPELLSLSKTTFKTTLLGFILVFIAWVLVNTILTMFGYIDPLGDGNWHIIC